ncbi:MAG: DUF5723 family protein [Paludibacter sp.]
MDNVPIRNSLNPAFQPIKNIYISLPVIGFTQFNVGNNSLSINDVIYNYNGQTISFLHPNGDINQFYNTLKSTTIVRADIQTNLLAFGFRYKSAFWNFSLTAKVDGYLGIPKDLFELSLFGTTSVDNNKFDLSALQTDVTAYTEAGIGYSKRINKQWLLGGKVKFLMGSANVSNTNTEMSMQLGVEQWNLKGSGSANVSSPTKIDIANNYQSVTIYRPASISDWLKPSGYGMGIDLGAVYSLTDRINLSAAIVDLGFINWNKNVQNINYGIDYTFDGVAQISSSQSSSTLKQVYTQLTTGNSLADSLTNAMQTSSKQNITNNSYSTGTTSKLNLGVEYELVDNYLSLGLLSRTFIFKKSVSEEVTASVNAHPFDWFDASTSYSFVNGRFNSIGAGIGLRTGIIHWFMAADYIPFEKTTYIIPLPYKSNVFNLAMGINLVFDSKTKSMKHLNQKTKKQSYKNPNCHCEYN